VSPVVEERDGARIRDHPAMRGDDMKDITIEAIGNVASDVSLRFTRSGDPVASFRLAAGTRRFDRRGECWVDGDTHYFTVTCWRSLAHNVVQSISKGMPVVVVGRLRSREVQRPCGDHVHNVRYFDIEASALGPDLARGVATFTRVKREAVVESEERAMADAMAAAGLLEDDLESGAVVDLETGEIVEAELRETA
jgi:single-strand DNA-binding protein